MLSFTVIIVSQGHDERLMKCLETLRPGVQDWELLIVSNGKALSPEVREKAQTITEHLNVIESEVKLTPGKALNLAKLNAQGKWLYFLADNAEVSEKYWEKVFPLLQDEKIDVVGGPLLPAKGMKGWNLALALAQSSPLCTGATSLRFKSQGNKLQYSDDEKLSIDNLWMRKIALEEINFPEDYLQSEELPVLQVLKRQVKGVFYHPKLVVFSANFLSLSENLKVFFYQGFYRSKVMKKKLKKGDEIFWLPAVFVLMHFLLFIDTVSFWYLARMYGSIILFVSIAYSMQIKRASLFILVAISHYLIVFMYGLGFLSERLGLKR